jgi:hypothetical protein
VHAALNQKSDRDVRSTATTDVFTRTVPSTAVPHSDTLTRPTPPGGTCRTDAVQVALLEHISECQRTQISAQKEVTRMTRAPCYGSWVTKKPCHAEVPNPFRADSSRGREKIAEEEDSKKGKAGVDNVIVEPAPRQRGAREPRGRR